MKLEVGKCYWTAGGRKVGPMLEECDIWHQIGCVQVWNEDGTVMHEEGDESHDYIIAEWTDEPKLWRDMTPEEKGALLLADHEGKVIEAHEPFDKEWFKARPAWFENTAYRVRPEPEPERETVVLYGGGNQRHGGTWAFDYQTSKSTHRLTFDLIGGKPDCASIRMEELNGMTRRAIQEDKSGE